MRDVDLLVVPDEADTRTLPFGRLREPLDAASAADALLVESDVRSADLPAFAEATAGLAKARSILPSDGGKVGPPRNAQPHFTFTRRLGGPMPDRRAFAFAGIAKPDKFFVDLEKAGWTLTGRRSFRDHHHYSAAEIDEVTRAAKSSGADVILTTEKDLVRIGTAPGILAVPLEVTIETAFAPWLAEQLRAVRATSAA
jgi:tetraacyldisaccharide 4'-kinase